MLWLFGCSPFLSNFLWSVPMDACINTDILRWLWVGVSVPIDLFIMAVPLRILKAARLRDHERRILKMVFSATLLGTTLCITGIYGVYCLEIRFTNQGFYEEMPYIILTDIEIFMYALGASFPVLSRYIVEKTKPASTEHRNFSSWARYVPSFFGVEERAVVIEPVSMKAAMEGEGAKSLQESETTAPSVGHGSDHELVERHDVPCPEEGVARHESESEGDLEKGEGIRTQTEVRVVESRDVGLMEFLRTSKVVDEKWGALPGSTDDMN
jgi:hypothetical protein